MIGIYEIDLKNGTFLRVSQNICAGLGYSEDELIGHSVEKVLTLQSMEHFRKRMDRMNSGEMLDGRVEYVAIARDGTLIPVAIEAFYKISNGRIIGAIVAAEEVENGRPD